MRNILICGYRDWAYDLYVNVDKCVIDHCVYVDDKDMLDIMIVLLSLHNLQYLIVKI